MADFNTPALTDNYTNIIGYLKSRDLDILMGLDPATTTPANLPNNAIRWNSANGYWEKLVSGTWGALISRYQIDVKTVMGYAPGNASGNVPLSNGTVNTNLNADMIDGAHAGTGANQVLLLDSGAHIPAASIPASGVTAGTYRSVTVAADGRLTAGSNPTTLSGYGITDAASINGNSGQNFSMNGGTFYGALKSQYAAGANCAPNAGDIAAVRSGGTTGVVYLNSAGDHYLFWDGSYYNLPASDLKINSNVAWHAGNFTPSNYLGVSAQAADSAKLGGQAASYYGMATGIVPTGTIAHFAGMTPPSNWLNCDGTAVSRSTYSNLFNAITMPATATTTSGSTTATLSAANANIQPGMHLSGAGIPAGCTVASISSTNLTLSAAATATASGVALTIAPYGVGDGSTTFNLPDFRSRDIIGAGQGASLSNRIIGTTGGEETHVISTSEMPAHNHTVTDTGHAHNTTNNSGLVGGGAGATANVTTGGGSFVTVGIASATTGISIGSTGGTAAHNNMHPYGVANVIIKT